MFQAYGSIRQHKIDYGEVLQGRILSAMTFFAGRLFFLDAADVCFGSDMV